MARTLALTATLEPRGPAGAFVLSDAQVQALGDGKKAFPVRVTVGGKALALRLARMGGENLIGLSKASRAEAGVEIGATYDVEIALDDTERTVEVPADLAAALAADPAAEAAFAAMSHTHRKEYARWVTEAKKPETRAKRIVDTVTAVREGRTR